MRTRRIRLLWAGAVAAVAIAAVVATAIAGGGRDRVGGELEGYQEVPSVSTGATGTFKARIVNGGEGIDYTLTYSGLEADATQSHIHFGQKGVNGGISAFFCSNLPNPPAGTPACPLRGGTLTGTIDASDVIGPTGQGIEPGALGELIAALRRGVTYANVHSTKWPGGEIRLQLRRKGKGHDKD